MVLHAVSAQAGCRQANHSTRRQPTMATNRAGDEVDLTTWIGRTESTADVVAPTPVAALHATLDYPIEAIPAGTALPPLWHWLYFLPMHRQSELGPDGHAERGGFLPPVPLPRRMWAGGRFDFRRPVRVGDAVRRTSTIADVSLKEGRTGPLAFVLVRHEIATAEGVALVEEHDIVYRDLPRPGEAAPAPRPAPSGAATSTPTTCCCSATRRSPSMATASTTTGAT